LYGGRKVSAQRGKGKTRSRHTKKPMKEKKGSELARRQKRKESLVVGGRSSQRGNGFRISGGGMKGNLHFQPKRPFNMLERPLPCLLQRERGGGSMKRKKKK